MPKRPPPLTYSETIPVLRALEGVDIVLVGGQAVNFWSEFYAARAPTLLESAPYASEDIDFIGTRAVVEKCAELLGGNAFLPDEFSATPSSGMVLFVDRLGYERRIDIIATVFGLDHDDVRATAIPIVVDVTDKSSPQLLVMHPERCLESRACNIVGCAADYDTELGRKQLKASIACTREFILDLLDEGEVRAVLKLGERLHRFLLDRMGTEVVARTGIDPFDALVTDPRLPEAFNLTRYPQMKLELETKRLRVERG